MFRKADRKKAKLRLALCGVAGSGKTYGALKIATGLGGKIALLDTERGSGELYSSEFNYDVASLDSDFSPQNYIKIIGEAERAGYDVLIIDSLSHAWMGEGGVLDILDKATKASSSHNSYTAWRHVTPQHNALVDAILKSQMHIIVTMRSKAEYVIVESEQNGKKRSAPQKIGLAPIQREGLDYEFTVVFDLSVDGNIATSSKDRTKLFTGKNIVISEQVGKDLLGWLEDGRSVEENDAELFEAYKAKIESASNMLELQKTFAQAYKQIATQKYRDSLIFIKDDKKEELSQQQEAV